MEGDRVKETSQKTSEKTDVNVYEGEEEEFELKA